MSLLLPTLEVSLFGWASCASRRAGTQLSFAGFVKREQRQQAKQQRVPVAPFSTSCTLERSSSEGSSSSSSSSPLSSGSSTSTPPTSPESESRSLPSSSSSDLPKPRFKFTLAASFYGKQQPKDGAKKPKYAFDFSSDSPVRKWRDEILSAQLNKEVVPGEDFLFTSYNKRSGSAAFGVFDGVGGWADSNVNAALFSQSLGYHAQRSAENLDRNVKDWSKEGVYPHDIVQAAYEGVQQEADVQAGSATASVVTLDPFSGRMRAANLGDSSFTIIRDSKVVHVQPSQLHYFNCPYQLSKLPAGLSDDSSSISNTPSQADLFETKLQENDLILCYTDGFGDNVFSNEVEVLIKRIQDNAKKLKETVGKSSDPLQEQKHVQRIADALRNYAKLCSEMEDKQSPFEMEAKKQGLNYRGGKVDDITVIVASVKAL